MIHSFFPKPRNAVHWIPWWRQGCVCNSCLFRLPQPFIFCILANKSFPSIVIFFKKLVWEKNRSWKWGSLFFFQSLNEALNIVSIYVSKLIQIHCNSHLIYDQYLWNVVWSWLIIHHHISSKFRVAKLERVRPPRSKLKLLNIRCDIWIIFSAMAQSP